MYHSSRSISLLWYPGAGAFINHFVNASNVAHLIDGQLTFETSMVSFHNFFMSKSVWPTAKIQLYWWHLQKAI
jgi:hypothetical protein